MVIKNLIKKDLVACSLSDTVYDAAIKMKENNVGSVLVVDQRKVLGILTDRDIVLKIVAESKDPKNMLASDIMTTNPTTISADADFESALKVMSEGNIRRLPVTQNGRVIGILSSNDLAVELKKEFDEFMTLEEAPAK